MVLGMTDTNDGYEQAAQKPVKTQSTLVTG